MNPKPLSSPICFLLILLFGIAAYSNTFTGSFQFDDTINILENRFLYPFNFGKLWLYYPSRFITNLSFAFNIYLAGFATWSFHALNLLIHILTSFMVFQVTRLILHTPSVKDQIPSSQQNLFALVVALLFTTHPVQTEAVSYIVQRATSLATFFYLATLWMYLKARLEDARHYRLVFLLIPVAMLTKEISFTLPFAILLTDLCFFPTSASETIQKKLRRWIPFTIFLWIIPLIFITSAESLVRSGGAMNILPTAYTKISRWDYLLTQFRVLRTYLRLLFFPVNQCFDYDYSLTSGWKDLDSWIAFAFLFGILMLAFSLFKKNRLLSFAILWFFLTLSVESTIIPLPDLILEHRLYLPMFGFVLFLSFVLWTISKSAKIFTAISLIIVIAFSGMTYCRNQVWKDPFTLWQDVIKKSPHKWRAYCSLGIAYARENDLKNALLYFHKALAAGSYTSFLLTNIATTYFHLGNSKEGAYYQKQAFSMANSETTHWRNALDYNQAAFLNLEKKKSAAINVLKKAIEVDPLDYLFYVELGKLYLETGQEDAAIRSFRKAIEVAPLSREGYDALALLYTKNGDQEKALSVVTEYLKCKKKHKPLLGN